MDIQDIIDAIQKSYVRISNHADEEPAFDHLIYNEISFSVIYMDRLAYKETERMIPFEECPICEGKLVQKKVEKLLR